VKVRFTVVLNEEEQKKERSTPLFIEGVTKFLDDNTVEVKTPNFAKFQRKSFKYTLSMTVPRASLLNFSDILLLHNSSS